MFMVYLCSKNILLTLKSYEIEEKKNVNKKNTYWLKVLI